MRLATLLRGPAVEGGELRGPRPSSQVSASEPDPLDHLAGVLREQLVTEAGEASAGALVEPGPRVAALVDREAGVLEAATRAELTRRIAERSFGLGPLEPLLADPDVWEIMINAPDRPLLHHEKRRQRSRSTAGLLVRPDPCS